MADAFYAMSPREFEFSVRDLLRQRGYREVVHRGGSGDLGIDLVALAADGSRVAVQCKRYALHRKVTGPEMQLFVGMTYTQGMARGIYATTSTYTAQAFELARKNNIELLDGSDFAAAGVARHSGPARAMINPIEWEPLPSNGAYRWRSTDGDHISDPEAGDGRTVGRVYREPTSGDIIKRYVMSAAILAGVGLMIWWMGETDSQAGIAQRATRAAATSRAVNVSATIEAFHVTATAMAVPKEGSTRGTVATRSAPAPTIGAFFTTQPGVRCDPSYPTVCITSPPPDVGCEVTSARNVPVRPPDPHDLDHDDDGIGCEPIE
jgi:hypothetical protein